MYDILEYREIENKDNILLVDVRTKEEYEKEHIPGALNYPIFNQDERKSIGIEYVNGNVEKAKAMGLAFAGSKISDLYLNLYNINTSHKKIVLYCSRGGYRSSAPAALFKALSLPVYKLSGGYKCYRKYINEKLGELIKEKTYITLFGNTGCGKTEILKKLKLKEEAVLDLEDLANHKGSLLGDIGGDCQPSQKMFESLLYQELKNKKDKIIFIEGESNKIGKIILPKDLLDALRNSFRIKIESDIDSRCERIEREYVNDNDEEIIEALDRLERYVGKSIIENLQNEVRKKNYKLVIKTLIERYYDKNYASRKEVSKYTLSAEDSKIIDKLLEIKNEEFKIQPQKSA